MGLRVMRNSSNEENPKDLLFRDRQKQRKQSVGKSWSLGRAMSTIGGIGEDCSVFLFVETGEENDDIKLGFVHHGGIVCSVESSRRKG